MTAAAFNDMVYSAGTDEQGAADGQTFATAPANLVSNRTYYWRARVSDPKNGIVSAFSAT